MTIYISIPTEHDPEIFHTVKNAISSADDPSSIYIGIACMTNLIFFNEIKKEFEKNKRIKIKHVDVSNIDNVGVGAGRNNAMSMYANEDYILQIDSHTMFNHGWDTFLINLFNEAIKETKNKKTIITSYLSSYQHTISSGRSQIKELPYYSFFRKNEFFLDTGGRIPRWDLKIITPTRFNKKIYKKIKNKKFIPAQKINAQFIFGNKYFYENYGLPKDIFFYEEEIIQSINLYDSGFSLVWPNLWLPLSHLYGFNADLPDSLAKRHRCIDAEEWKVKFRKTGEYYKNFILDEKNKIKCEKYQKYSGIDLLNGSLDEDIIPLKYRYS